MSAILSLLAGNKLTRNTLAFLLAGLAMWAVYAGVAAYHKRQGFNAALHAVEQQNKVAAKAAEKVRLSVDDCFDRGGDWNVIQADCDL